MEKIAMSTEQKITSPHWESFLRNLANKISEPTSNQLTSRCWSLKSLTTMIQEIRTSGFPSNFPRTREILKHLINIGWAYRIDVEPPSAAITSAAEFYLLDIGAAHGITVDPLELLQASRPSGVICYLSALTYHSLTTQFPTHHHIAVIYKAAPAHKAYDNQTSVVEDKPTASIKKSSLGNHLFTYEGVPFYQIKRSASRLIGVQTRILGPRTNLRITNIEQTLLDTLHMPKYCGGPPIVFESWEEGISNLDDDLLEDYLKKIDSHLILRRVGAMFDLLGFTPSRSIASILENVLKKNSMASAIPMLPGYDFPVINNKWKVMTP
jgi:predicted transcriptional regulator of viral defense system